MAAEKFSFRRNKVEINSENNIPKIGNNLNFAGKESYKLLRTNILLSFPDNSESKVIGITSAEVGDGKTTTASNLALSIAESGTRVVLVEADMRRKNAEMLEILGVDGTQGLSNKLVGQCALNDILKRSKLNKNFYVIPAGSIPPNPSELLLSSSMDSFINALKKVFDYIIVDLPPINVVNDALAATRLVDGIVVVTRSNVSRKASITYAINQIEFAGAKIIGIVLNDFDIFNKGYYGNYSGKYGKYLGRYGSGYYNRRYGYGYNKYSYGRYSYGEYGAAADHADSGKKNK